MKTFFRIALLALLAAGSLAAQSVPPVQLANAASYGPFLTPHSIVAAFSTGMTTGFEAASELPLPTTLAGVSVNVNGVPAGLFFASGQQVNFLMPDLDAGNAVVEVRGTDGVVRHTRLTLVNDAPAVFTLNQSGNGSAAAIYLSFSGDPTARYAVLYLTGLSDFDPTHITLNCSGMFFQPAWAGHTVYAGLRQINFRLPVRLTGQTFRCSLRVNDNVSNTFDLKP